MNDLTYEHELLAAALEAVEALGITGRVVGSAVGSDDAVVELARDGQVHRYAVEAKRLVRPSTVALAADQVRSRSTNDPVLLVTEQVSPETAELLQRRRIEFVDTAGNAYLDRPGFLVLISGRRSERGAAAKPVDRIGPAALQVAFVLLREPDAAELSVRALGERAGVSHGAAAAALNAFDKRGWIRNLGRKGQHVVDGDEMLASWLVGFANQLAPRLEIVRAAPAGRAAPSGWARNVLDEMGPDIGLLGGEAAAEAAGHDIRGSTASVFVRSWDVGTMKRLRLVPAPDGRVFVRSTFAPQMHDPGDRHLVDPLIVLAEIAAIPDERLDAARASLRSTVTARLPR